MIQSYYDSTFNSFQAGDVLGVVVQAPPVELNENVRTAFSTLFDETEIKCGIYNKG